MQRPLAALSGGGTFIFAPLLGSYEELSQTWSASWARHDVIGAPAVRQFTGPDDRELSIRGGIWPEIQLPGLWRIEALASVAESGRPVTFILASGRVVGRFVIEEVTKDESLIEGLGYPGEIQFDLRLVRHSGGLSWPF